MISLGCFCCRTSAVDGTLLLHSSFFIFFSAFFGGLVVILSQGVGVQSVSQEDAIAHVNFFWAFAFMNMCFVFGLWVLVPYDMIVLQSLRSLKLGLFAPRDGASCFEQCRRDEEEYTFSGEVDTYIEWC